LSRKVLNARIPQDYISINMSLDNYDGLVDLREHVQNMHSSLELVVQDNDAMCKILLITFKESACAWYDNLESGSIEEFRDL